MSALNYRTAYRAGTSSFRGWCCRYCHRVQFPPSRRGFARLILHRGLAHRRFTFREYDPLAGCLLSHHGSPWKLVTLTYGSVTVTPAGPQ